MNGRTYYSFRAGSVWGLLLDCGEDKCDEHPEYGGTVCFHPFRLAETEYIKQIIENAECEYAADGVTHKLVISHIPFTHINEPPFDIEQELYAEWTRLMRDFIKPDLLLYGHYHCVEIVKPGDRFDSQGQPCNAVIGSKPIFDKENGNGFVGCAITLMENRKKRIVFNDNKGVIYTNEVID